MLASRKEQTKMFRHASSLVRCAIHGNVQKWGLGSSQTKSQKEQGMVHCFDATRTNIQIRHRVSTNLSSTALSMLRLKKALNLLHSVAMENTHDEATGLTDLLFITMTRRKIYGRGEFFLTCHPAILKRESRMQTLPTLNPDDLNTIFTFNCFSQHN